jgi:predicted Zn-dependent peptidase
MTTETNRPESRNGADGSDGGTTGTTGDGLTRARSSTMTVNSVGSSADGRTTDGEDGTTSNGTLGTTTTTTTTGGSVTGESTAAHARRKSDKESLRRAIGEKFPYDVRDHGNANKALAIGPAGRVRHGRLGNGMAYYVAESQKPKDHAALALCVDVGSIAEEEEERGVAHVVEHLAFRCTERYEHFAIVDFLESIGAEFGACQNAYTSMDETVYELTVPIDKPEVLATSMHILSEFASGVRISDEDVDCERGSVLEEWRLGRDARGRAAEAYWKTLMEGSLYAERSPIGLENVIREADPQVLRNFYAKWYRPERMAVVAVGDFSDLDGVVDLIKNTFSHLTPKPGQPKINPEVVRPPLSTHTEPRVVAHVDRELKQTAVTVTFKYASIPVDTPRGYYLKTVEDVYKTALDNRLYRIMRQPKPPFFNAGGFIEDATRTTTLLSVQAACAESRAVEALTAVLRELARIRLHGISEQELKIAKANMLADTEQLYAEREQTYCESVRDELVCHFLRGDLVIGAEDEAVLAKACIERVSQEDVLAFATQLSVRNSCVIRVQEGRKYTSEADLCSAIEQVRIEEFEGSIDESEVFNIPEVLMDASSLKPGTVIASRHLPALEMHEITLSNGMRIGIKVTDFLDDQVLLRGCARGGLSEVSEGEYIHAMCANMVAGELGIYGHRPDIYDGILAGLRTDVAANVSMYRRNIEGETSPVDIETALQCIHLLFTHNVGTTNDPEVLETLMLMQEEKIKNQSRDPESNYSEVVRSLVYGKSYHSQRITVKSLRKMDSAKACEFFHTCFLDPSEFTLVFVGAIETQTFMSLVEKYLGSIPRANPSVINEVFAGIATRERGLTPFPLKFPTREIKRTVRAHMSDPMSKASITFPVRIPNPDHGGQISLEGGRLLTIAKFKTIMTASIIEKRLLALLRFEYGEIYTCHASASFGFQEPDVCGPTYCGDIMVGFSCAPDRGAHLARHARDVVKVLREHGPTEEEVNAVRECEIRDFEVSRQENSFWREYITELYKSRLVRKSLLDEDIDSLYQMTEEIRNEVIDALSPTLVRDHLKDVMSLNTSVTVVLKPQRSILKRIFVPSFETRGEALYSVAYLSGIALATSAIFARLKKDR